MKKLLSIITVLLIAIVMLVSCVADIPSTDTVTSESGEISVGTQTSTLPDDTLSTDSGSTTPNLPPDDEIKGDGEINSGDNSGQDPSEPSNPETEKPEPEEPKPEEPKPEEPKPEEPTEVEITVSKTADEMAASIGKYENGDIVSGEQIALDSNIFVSFGKGSASTEPALYSGAIRIYQKGGILTVYAKNDCTIKEIVITFADNKSGSGKLVTSDGTSPVVSGNTVTLTPSLSSVTVTVSGTSKTDRLYVESIEVTYMGKEDDLSGTDKPGADADGDDVSGGEYLYYGFTADEKSIYNEYIGFTIPFLPNNDYCVEAYDEGGYRGVHYSALCQSSSSFDIYLAMFSSYENDGTAPDEYGDIWYLYSKDGIYIDIRYCEYDGKYYVDVYAYPESDSGNQGGTEDDDDGYEGEYLYYDFTADEKSIYNEYIGFTIPFLPTDDYYIQEYDEDGYRGVYYSALCEVSNAFNWYLAMFSSYQSDGTELDEYGDTWYLYSENDIYIDVCYYEYEGAYYVDVDAYSESGAQGEDGDGSLDDDITDDESVITNEGAALPEDDGDGIYDVSLKDAENVKDVTDQGYYLDGCPTVGSPGVLVIPVEFSDRTALSLGYSIENIKKAFEKGGENEYYSVYDYYFKSSMGQLTLDITVVDEWFRPSNPSTYYANKTMSYGGTDVLIGDQAVMDEALAYLSGIMDLSKFDSDSNGIIDAVVLVTTLKIDSESDFYWAYRYWNIYTDSDEYYYEYDGVSANDYLWASYEFLREDTELNGDYSSNTVNPYTFIHEFGHILGVDDYYDTSYVGSPLDGYDVMDSMLGDHNAYTKFNLGWITTTRLVVTDTSVTVTLRDFSQSGDTLILANNWNPRLGAYQEYYILVYYTKGELNSGMGGYFDADGIIVYHVNASLYAEEYEGEVYYDVYNNNTDPSDEYGTKNNLIELVPNGNGYVYGVGDTMSSQTDDLGQRLGYTFTVDSISDEAVITVTAR